MLFNDVMSVKNETYDSMSDALNVLDTLVGCASFNLNTLSMTEISVDVELMPTNALQSFTTQPAPSTSLPRFTVPAWTIKQSQRSGMSEIVSFKVQMNSLICI